MRGAAGGFIFSASPFRKPPLNVLLSRQRPRGRSWPSSKSSACTGAPAQVPRELFALSFLSMPCSVFGPAVRAADDPRGLSGAAGLLPAWIYHPRHNELDNIFQVQAWMKNMASLTNLGLGHGPMI